MSGNKITLKRRSSSDEIADEEPEIRKKPSLFGEISPKLKSKHKHEENSLRELIQKYKELPGAYREYKQVKYKNTIYTINDAVYICNQDDTENDFIGRLQNIIKISHNNILIILVQIQWYYKKSDLSDKFEAHMNLFSDNELFQTEHIDATFIQCINGQCDVLKYEEYDVLNSIPPNTFFYRAKYDHVKRKIDPPIERWQKHCLCNSPLNPDHLVIQCEICDKWYHPACLKLTDDEAEGMENFICAACTKVSETK